MIKKIFFWGLITILFFTYAAAQNENSLLKKVQDKYNSIPSFSANFTQYSENSKKITGKFFYKKDNNIKIETGTSTIVSNGSTNWNYNKKQNKVIITDYDDSDASMFSFNKIIYDFPAKSNVEQTSENESNILIITPDETGPI